MPSDTERLPLRCPSCKKAMGERESVYGDEHGLVYCFDCYDAKRQLERHVRIRAEVQLHTRIWQFIAIACFASFFTLLLLEALEKAGIR